MKDLIKTPLILAAVIIVSRLGLEGVGAPGTILLIVGVTWLHFLVPIYFGVRIDGAGGSTIQVAPLTMTTALATPPS